MFLHVASIRSLYIFKMELFLWCCVPCTCSDASNAGIPSNAGLSMKLHTKVLRLLSVLCGDPTIMSDKVLLRELIFVLARIYRVVFARIELGIVY